MKKIQSQYELINVWLRKIRSDLHNLCYYQNQHMTTVKRKKQEKFILEDCLNIFNGTNHGIKTLNKAENLLKVLWKLFFYSVAGFLTKIVSKLFRF